MHKPPRTAWKTGESVKLAGVDLEKWPLDELELMPASLISTLPADDLKAVCIEMSRKGYMPPVWCSSWGPFPHG